MKAKLIKTEVNYILEDDKGVVIASTSLNKEGLSLSIKNCQAIEHGYDLDVLARQEAEKLYNKSEHEDYSVWEYLVSGEVESIKLGFQKALELMGDKKFSAGQLLNAMDLVWQWMNGEDYGCKTLTEVQEKHLKSLQQNEWDVEIVMDEEKEFIFDPAMGISQGHYLDKPKLDENGCLILKRI